MDYTAKWEEVAGDYEGVQIAPQNGSHDPSWPDLDEHTQGVLTEVCRASEQIIQELCIMGAGPEEGQARRFRIESNGHVNSGDDGDSTPNSVTLTVTETTK